MNVYASEEDCHSRLGKRLQRARVERPDEWTMDGFIREAEVMQAEIERLKARLKVLQKAALWTGNGKWKRIMIDEGTDVHKALWGGK